jgi:hypothetical protein
MDSALLFLRTRVSFFRLDDIWARSEIKYSAKMGFLRVDLLAPATRSKKPAQTWELEVGCMIRTSSYPY